MNVIQIIQWATVATLLVTAYFTGRADGLARAASIIAKGRR